MPDLLDIVVILECINQLLHLENLIGIGENILYLFRYEEDGKPLSRITREQFEEFYTRLSTMNEEQMEEHFGVNREYASLLMPCAVIYKKFLEKFFSLFPVTM